MKTRLRTPYLLDQVEDKTRSRFVNAIAIAVLPALLTLFFVTPLLRSSEEDVALSPLARETKIYQLPERGFVIGKFLKSPIILHVTNGLEAGVAGASAEIKIHRIEDRGLCNGASPTSFHGYRTGRLCSPVIEGVTATTNDDGVAVFASLRIRTGVEGLYTFEIVITVCSALDEREMLLSSLSCSGLTWSQEAAESSCSTAFKLSFALRSVGSPLSASGLVPRVQVRWLDGSPAQDQTVMMMAVYNLSWAFDTTVRKAFAPVGPNAKGFYDPTKLNFGDQLLVMEGNVVNTDSDGVATFENASIVATNSRFHIFGFVCGAMTVLWQESVVQMRNDSFDANTPYLSGGAPEALVVQKGSFPSGYTPIVIREVLPSLRDRRRILLSFRVEPPSIVVEGDSLTAFGINVLDSSGAPVEGVRVIATVAQVPIEGSSVSVPAWDSASFSSYHKETYPGPFKDLENILSDESDSNGLLRIETLRFSRRGRTGIYKVRFTAFASTESLSLAMQCASQKTLLEKPALCSVIDFMEETELTGRVSLLSDVITVQSRISKIYAIESPAMQAVCSCNWDQSSLLSPCLNGSRDNCLEVPVAKAWKPLYTAASPFLFPFVRVLDSEGSPVEGKPFAVRVFDGTLSDDRIESGTETFTTRFDIVTSLTDENGYAFAKQIDVPFALMGANGRRNYRMLYSVDQRLPVESRSLDETGKDSPPTRQFTAVDFVSSASSADQCGVRLCSFLDWDRGIRPSVVFAEEEARTTALRPLPQIFAYDALKQPMEGITVCAKVEPLEDEVIGRDGVVSRPLLNDFNETKFCVATDTRGRATFMDLAFSYGRSKLYYLSFVANNTAYALSRSADSVECLKAFGLWRETCTSERQLFQVQSRPLSVIPLLPDNTTLSSLSLNAGETVFLRSRSLFSSLTAARATIGRQVRLVLLSEGLQGSVTFSEEQLPDDDGFASFNISTSPLTHGRFDFYLFSMGVVSRPFSIDVTAPSLMAEWLSYGWMSATTTAVIHLKERFCGSLAVTVRSTNGSVASGILVTVRLRQLSGGNEGVSTVIEDGLRGTSATVTNGSGLAVFEDLLLRTAVPSAYVLEACACWAEENCSCSLTDTFAAVDDIGLSLLSITPRYALPLTRIPLSIMAKIQRNAAPAGASSIGCYDARPWAMPSLAVSCSDFVSGATVPLPIGSQSYATANSQSSAIAFFGNFSLAAMQEGLSYSCEVHLASYSKVSVATRQFSLGSFFRSLETTKTVASLFSLGTPIHLNLKSTKSAAPLDAFTPLSAYLEDLGADPSSLNGTSLPGGSLTSVLSVARSISATGSQRKEIMASILEKKIETGEDGSDLLSLVLLFRERTSTPSTVRIEGYGSGNLENDVPLRSADSIVSISAASSPFIVSRIAGCVCQEVKANDFGDFKLLCTDFSNGAYTYSARPSSNLTLSDTDPLFPVEPPSPPTIIVTGDDEEDKIAFAEALPARQENSENGKPYRFYLFPLDALQPLEIGATFVYKLFERFTLDDVQGIPDLDGKVEALFYPDGINEPAMRVPFAFEGSVLPATIESTRLTTLRGVYRVEGAFTSKAESGSYRLVFDFNGLSYVHPEVLTVSSQLQSYVDLLPWQELTMILLSTVPLMLFGMMSEYHAFVTLLSSLSGVALTGAAAFSLVLRALVIVDSTERVALRKWNPLQLVLFAFIAVLVASLLLVNLWALALSVIRWKTRRQSRRRRQNYERVSHKWLPHSESKLHAYRRLVIRLLRRYHREFEAAEALEGSGTGTGGSKTRVRSILSTLKRGVTRGGGAEREGGVTPSATAAKAEIGRDNWTRATPTTANATAMAATPSQWSSDQLPETAGGRPVTDRRELVRNDYGPIAAGGGGAVRARLRSIGEDIRDMIRTRKDAHRHFEGRLDFFYPQRLLIAAFVSLFATVLCGLFAVYLTLEFSVSVQNTRLTYIRDSLATVLVVNDGYATNLSDISLRTVEGTASVSSIILSSVDADFRSPETIFTLSESVGLPVILLPLLHLLRFAGGEGAVLLSSAVRYCGFLATGAAVATILLNWAFTLRLYRARIMLVRQGKYFFDRQRVRLEDASAYPGRQLASVVLGFWLVFAAVFSVSFLLWWETVRVAIWQVVGVAVALSLAVSSGCYLLSRAIGLALAPFTSVKHRRFFNLFDTLFLFLNFGAGAGVGLLRLVQAFAKFVFGFSRVDIPTFPGQRQLERIDGGYAAYLAMLCLDHEQNSPIVSVFMHQVIRELRARRNEKAKGETEKFSAPMEAALARAARLNTTRWQIIYTLLNNPRLQPLRKHAMYGGGDADNQTY